MVGLIATGDGNIVIGKRLEDEMESDDYIIYNERDVISETTTSCATYDDPGYAPMLNALLSKPAHCGQKIV